MLTVTWVNLKTIPQRKGAAGAAAFGIAGTVGVLVGVLSIGQGLQSMMNASGTNDTAMILRAGSDSEMTSGLELEETLIIADAPKVARNSEGPLAAAELFVIIDLPKRKTGTDANVPLRGVQGNSFNVRDGMTIVSGRRFEPGRNEIIVGVGAAREFAGLDLGATLHVGRNEWEVVGIFSAENGIAESEIWTDAAILQSAYQRGSSFQAVHAKLDSSEDFQEFKDALTADPRLNVKVIRQSEYYAEQSELVSTLVRVLGGIIAVLMSMGACFGALNTMYTSVAARTQEIAILRALGFGGMVVVISVLIESLILSLVGGLIGAGVAYLVFDGFRAATLNWASFSQVTFAFQVTPGLILLGTVIAALIGLIGGFFPAVRAARLPIASALRDA